MNYQSFHYIFCQDPSVWSTCFKILKDAVKNSNCQLYLVANLDSDEVYDVTYIFKHLNC